ncbi:uncharacterized protein LOC110855885 isoform X3 [Folsomia candida]|uniref:uncharacterized protein LOC110855885 isoform X3 n=1 Tax=Folsomia candida TaxID=158441 RepID=UPI000B90643B|nr:uncharacterized protein LOC110855885 isoform X3 [Folsomia candida]
MIFLHFFPWRCNRRGGVGGGGLAQIITTLLWCLVGGLVFSTDNHVFASKDSSVIEEVNSRQLAKLLDEKDFVAVLWMTKNCPACVTALQELEKIDDDTDKFGVEFVKIIDKRTAKNYGVDSFPTLTYFRNKEPVPFTGDLENEDAVLEFLTSLDSMDSRDRIEEVNAKILDRIVHEDGSYVAVLFYTPDCRKCEKVLRELENIDDEADELGIAFVKIQDDELADEYNLESLPSLVYYRLEVPIVFDGDLTNEEDVLEWLITNKNSGDDEDDEIEAVSAKALWTLVDSIDHLAVLFLDSSPLSEAALKDLELIDDDCSRQGIEFVKTDDKKAAKEFGVENLPALVYFEQQIPNVYDGDLRDEDEVLKWLLHQKDSDEIEDVTSEMLSRLIKEKKHLVVLFYDDDEKESSTVLAELENIDDECDQHGVTFVKIDDMKEAAEFGIEDTPKLVYFENTIPSIYGGDLTKEEKVLEWLIEQVETDEIEEVTDEMLNMLINNNQQLSVLFSEHHDVAVLFINDKDSRQSQKILDKLENIDSRCDEHGIPFVKLSDETKVRELGIPVPSLVYFENKIPHLYEGSLEDEEETLEWLLHQLKSDEIEEVTDEMLDQLIEHHPYVTVLFYDKDDKTDLKILTELENIDDELDGHGMLFVKIDNDEEAKEYGFEELPVLVYFENKIPSVYEGDLGNEEKVLEWLLEQKHSDTIEEVTDEMLQKLIGTNQYVAVYFSGDCGKGEKCAKILEDLESLDDDADEAGITMVTTEETIFATKSLGLRSFPSLVLFRNGDPLLFKGDITDEDEVLTWITDEDNLELPDQIEEVNLKMLQRLLHTTEHVIVFFYRSGDKKSARILQELENIDDEADAASIAFVKISDEAMLREYDLDPLPALVYFNEKFPMIYPGDMSKEEAVLDWVFKLKEADRDQIEEVDHRTLRMLLDEMDNVAVFYFEDDCGSSCDKILEELEHIDDDASDVGIHFVKTTDTSVAEEELRLTEFPKLVYYQGGLPSIYRGSLEEEGEVLHWLVYQRKFEALPELTRNDLDDLVQDSDYLSIVFYANLTHEESTRTLRRASLIAEDAATFGIPIAKMNDALMAKRFGVKELPGLVLFRRGRHIRYDDDLDDEEEMLDWLTAPENMILRDQIEVVNRKMLDRMRETTEHLATMFFSETDCKQCQRVVESLEQIDDEADENGIAFVRVDDWELAKSFGVHALPALLYFKLGSDEPIIFAGDLRSPQKILEWLLMRKDPSGTAIEEKEGEELGKMIEEEGSSLVVYFFNKTVCKACEPDNKKKRKEKKKEGKEASEESAEAEAERLAGCAMCREVLEKLETVDEEVARHGVNFYRTADADFAGEIGVAEFPALVYFEDSVASVFEGELTIEEDVLHWIVEHKTESRIELITRGMLEQALIETAYLAVFFYKQPCRACDAILMELEHIDDDCDSYGIHMVKIADPQLAKRYGITTFPALLYFRNGNPLLFDGDLKNEDSVLDWLTDEENRELADEIEAVNLKMLEKLVDSSPFLAVFFYDEDDCEEECENILLGLEEIDDEADAYGIDMVKVVDGDTAAEFNIMSLPAMVYFRKGTALIYEGDLMDSASILGWLTSNEAFELKDEIEEVNRRMLEKLLDENAFVCVYFYEEESLCPKCGEILQELERVDVEVENLDILFVRIEDTKYAKKWGVAKIPAIVYFRRKFPSIYRGDLGDEQAVLEWLQKNRYKQPELNLFMFALASMSLAFVVYTVFILLFLKHPETPN